MVGKRKKYDQCSQLADGEIVTLLDGGMNDGYCCSGGCLVSPGDLWFEKRRDYSVQAAEQMWRR